MREFLGAVWRTHPPLAWALWFTTALLAVSLAAMPFDARLVAGVNPWLKPLKFEISIAVFLLTVGWLLLQLPGREGPRRAIAAGVALAMSFEIAAIVFQAARGVMSHFNSATPFDSAVFGAMGFAILANTLLMGWLLVLYWRAQPALPPAVVWGIRLGLIAFLLASAQGGLLVRNNAHTVGAPDGGPGLFFLNWSTTHGDLRVAHFAGMHGLQLLPLLGWVLSRTNRNTGAAAVFAAFAVLMLLFAWTLREALMGRPLVRL